MDSFAFVRMTRAQEESKGLAPSVDQFFKDASSVATSAQWQQVQYKSSHTSQQSTSSDDGHTDKIDAEELFRYIEWRFGIPMPRAYGPPIYRPVVMTGAAGSKYQQAGMGAGMGVGGHAAATTYHIFKRTQGQG
ncbi:unnamed protein product [Vitrella brassicaformis CCMP3155]|uniref:Uncharacterized protein n=1 Tax=Vitrella brassicaformis (strain CCMP3155) TaxID=1169540 RepID=A0A0G4GD02_VITBC|nr:unnamed protein product [Vitrella brassicaformis CCMP3155]|eukprot:CEM26775.1 unnamed protein product [Vitrella brassicaformis CCMP3155]